MTLCSESPKEETSLKENSPFQQFGVCFYQTEAENGLENIKQQDPIQSVYAFLNIKYFLINDLATFTKKNSVFGISLRFLFEFKGSVQ